MLKTKTLKNNPKTPTSLPSLPSPLAYETPIIESKEDTVEDTYHSLEEKMNLFNIEVIAMKSLSRKDSALQKSPCDHNSEIGRLAEETAYLRNENRTKSCIIQALLESDNTQQKLPAPNKSDFKVPNKYARNTENHSANNTYVSTSNRYQELSKNDDIANKSNTGDYVKPTKAAESNKTNFGKRNNFDTTKSPNQSK